MTGEVKSNSSLVTVAAGCFWGVEELLRDIPGVISTTVGYTGGNFKNPTYADVKTGQTGHAESVQLVVDPNLFSFPDFLRDWFFKLHNPTTRHQQGNDIGSQYRSAIFFHDDIQKRQALEVISEITALRFWKSPIVTEVVPAAQFYSAEEYHQDYLKKNPDGYTCHFVRSEPELK